jgi:hypothetical protein
VTGAAGRGQSAAARQRPPDARGRRKPAFQSSLETYLRRRRACMSRFRAASVAFRAF